MLLADLRVEPGIVLEEKIGEGQHREVFRSGNLAVKILKPFRLKQRWLRTVRLPLQIYIQTKYAIEDFNQHEQENYWRLAGFIPRDSSTLFNRIYWAGYYEGQSISISDLVLNDDGSFAKSLAKSGVILDTKFWNGLDEIETLLLSRKMFFIGINDDNVLVQTKNGVQQPVLVDYKWLGREAYPCQFWLRWEIGLRRKLKSKFQRMRDLYKPR